MRKIRFVGSNTLYVWICTPSVACGNNATPYDITADGINSLADVLHGDDMYSKQSKRSQLEQGENRKHNASETHKQHALELILWSVKFNLVVVKMHYECVVWLREVTGSRWMYRMRMNSVLFSFFCSQQSLRETLHENGIKLGFAHRTSDLTIFIACLGRSFLLLPSTSTAVVCHELSARISGIVSPFVVQSHGMCVRRTCSQMDELHLRHSPVFFFVYFASNEYYLENSFIACAKNDARRRTIYRVWI